MKNDRLLKSIVIGVVTLLHAGVVYLAWNGVKPPEIHDADSLAFVDLGTLEGDDKPAAEGAPAPENPPEQQPPAEPPKPEPPKPEPPKEKPKPVEKPKVAAVVRKDKPADFVQPKKPELPKEKPKPEPKPQPEPAERTLKPEPPKPPAPPVQKAETPPHPAQETGSNPQAQNRAPDSNGGGGRDSDSKAPKNSSGGQQGEDGKGKKGLEDKPHQGNNGNSIVDGGYITIPNPKYPASALERQEGGTVKLAVVVGPDGSVKSVSITQASSSAALNNAAKNAARKARYEPKKVNGEPVTTRFTTSFTFKLE